MSRRQDSKKKKRGSGKPKMNSTEDFLSSGMAQFPTETEGVGDGILQMMQQMMSSDPETMFAPMTVTPAVKKKISRLPVANQTWMAIVQVDTMDEGSFDTAYVFLVDKEKGSNGMPLGDSDGVGMNLATVGAMSHARVRTDRFPVLLGAIATACLEPMKHQQAMFSLKGTAKQAFPSQAPARLLLESSGTIEQLRPDLLEMGICNLDVADPALIQSVTPIHNRTDFTTSDITAMGKLASSTSEQEFRQAAAEMLMTYAEDVYVSEEPQPLNGWVPPDSSIPRDWYIRPPPDGGNGPYRQTELWGWRTNLERAVLQTDVEKIQEIAQRCDSDEVRKFCECRILLTKVAEKGMLKASHALLDFCSVAVDGVRDTPAQWRRMQKEAGYTGNTPLHCAAFEGFLPVVNLLLEHGASVTAVDDKLGGTALLHAVSQGHSDVVRALLEHGSDPSYYAPTGGEALDLSQMMEMQGGAHVAAQRRVRQVIREYDPRCSHCRATGPSIKECPCHLERYCAGRECQRIRWKQHKKQHKEKMSN